MASERNGKMDEITTRYMIFRRIPSTGKTSLWNVLNKSDGGALGLIQWYGAWRQYVFEAVAGCVFNGGCLDTISGILKRLNQEQRET